ncbi:MAG: Hsp20/alpha crystallin family protein [Deltaproteobacteria bacterium]|nr:Hsp20/alpha crystallin family protein [Deltaproteobacteria bacterium]
MLTAWNAFPMLDRLFDDVMNEVTGQAYGAAARATFTPAIDVRANDDELVFVCDVPGVQRDHLEITIEGGALSIKGHRAYQGREKERVLLGRSYGAFESRFSLPDTVDADRMTAELVDGVLTITVPKLPKAKPRRIAIGGGSAPKQLGEKNEEK